MWYFGIKIFIANESITEHNKISINLPLWLSWYQAKGQNKNPVGLFGSWEEQYIQ